MEKIVDIYYGNNAKKLHKIVDRILSRFGGLSDKDTDDFYSLANEVFVDVMRRYDSSQDFASFLYFCLYNRIKTEITRRNREKRKADKLLVSLDTPVGDDDDSMLSDIIAGSMTVEKELFEENEEGYSRRMLLYLNRLSRLQRAVLKLSTVGYSPNEIRNELHISEKQYTDCCAAIHAYRNVSVLL